MSGRVTQTLSLGPHLAPTSRHSPGAVPGCHGSHVLVICLGTYSPPPPGSLPLSFISVFSPNRRSSHRGLLGSIWSIGCCNSHPCFCYFLNPMVNSWGGGRGGTSSSPLTCKCSRRTCCLSCPSWLPSMSPSREPRTTVMSQGIHVLYLLLHVPLSLHPSAVRHAFGHVPPSSET